MKEGSMTKRIGIYSGTFDPIHAGHIAFAQQALDRAKLDKLFFLVEPRPRRKQGVRALEHREAMVRLALHSNKHFGMVQLEQANFSVEETLPKLRALFEGAQLYFLMGEDVFSHLSRWPHINDLLSSSSFIVGTRKQDEVAMRDVLKELQKTRGAIFDVSFIETDQQNVASTKIRLAFKRGKEPVGLLPETASYIQRNGLYVTEE